MHLSCGNWTWVPGVLRVSGSCYLTCVHTIISMGDKNLKYRNYLNSGKSEQTLLNTAKKLSDALHQSSMRGSLSLRTNVQHCRSHQVLHLNLFCLVGISHIILALWIHTNKKINCLDCFYFVEHLLFFCIFVY